jgi:hypothetical protein
MKKIKFTPLLITYSLILITFLLSSCGVYSFRDVSIDYTKTKTIKINYIENNARYINPVLSPQLTDKLKQKISSSTKLIVTNSDNADLVINGNITDYSVSTAAISTTQAATNRLSVTVHLSIKNNKENSDPEEKDVTRNFDFPATLSLSDAEAISGYSDFIKALIEDIFNNLFSKW